mmetsp:Transcript_26015/g.23032  ORF Transcript_26015/g.23032 Transcript_26015/m.23032 type:complete len:103 (+) Transcript_26015:2-310(+)
MSEENKFLLRSRSVNNIISQASTENFHKLMEKLKKQKQDKLIEDKRTKGKEVEINRRSRSTKRSISPEGLSPWKRSKIINEPFEPLKYKNMGKINGEVMRHA